MVCLIVDIYYICSKINKYHFDGKEKYINR